MLNSLVVTTKSIKFIDNQWCIQTVDNILLVLNNQGVWAIRTLPMCDREIMRDCSVDELYEEYIEEVSND